jgi:cysteine-rich repeat protein
MFISLQQQLLQSMEPALTFSQAVKSSETLELLLLPGLIAGSRFDNDAVCTSIVNLLSVLGRKILYDSQLKMMQEQLFSQQLWNIAGGLLKLQMRNKSPSFKASTSSNVPFLRFDFYRVDSASQRGNNFWTFSSTSERVDLGANFSISKNIIADSAILDVVVAVQEFSWKSSDPNFLPSSASTLSSRSKSFYIVGALYGIQVLDFSRDSIAITEVLNTCMNLSVSFDSLIVRKWNQQQRFAKVSIASYNSSMMVYSNDNCQTITVGSDHVHSCCKSVSQFAVKVTPGATICGDGFSDVENGEECDDGNVIDGDGCDKSCTIERLYRCERSIPNFCTIVPTNVSATCIPPRTCNGRGLYLGGSACICESTFFRADCSLNLRPLAAPSILENGGTHVLAPGLNLSITSPNIIPFTYARAFNDSEVQEGDNFRENGQTGEIMRSTQIQFEFDPPIEIKNSTIVFKLNVSGFVNWVGSPMLTGSKYSLFCLKPTACLWTQMRSTIPAQYVIQSTITNNDLPIMRRCAIFEFTPVLEPPTPEADDNSSVIVVYVGSSMLALYIIALFIYRKYRLSQAARATAAQVSLPVDEKDDVDATGAPSKVLLSPEASASLDDPQQIQSSPRELAEVNDLDVDLLDDSILAAIIGIEQLPMPESLKSVQNLSMSLSPSPGKNYSRRPVSPPALPRTPDGRRRPKVKNTFSSQSQLYSSKPLSPTQSAESEKIQIVKSLSPTEKMTGSSAQSVSPMTRPEPFIQSKKAAKDAPPVAFSQFERTLKRSKESNVAISSSRNLVAATPAAVVATSPGSSGVEPKQRSRILRDEDDVSVFSPVLSDIFPTGNPSRMPTAIASTLRDPGSELNPSYVFQASDIDR